MSTTFKVRRDTAANWTTANPTLASGEPGYETDTRKIKYGDGTTAWTTLGYSVAASGNFSNIVAVSATITTAGAQSFSISTIITAGLLFVNGLQQDRSNYTVGSGTLSIPLAMQLLPGDFINFIY